MVKNATDTELPSLTSGCTEPPLHLQLPFTFLVALECEAGPVTEHSIVRDSLTTCTMRAL